MKQFKNKSNLKSGLKMKRYNEIPFYNDIYYKAKKIEGKERRESELREYNNSRINIHEDFENE